jgi:multidrug efflux pump
VPSYPNAPLYASNVLRTVFLEFENSDWEKELADFKGTEVEVPAKVTVDGKVYPDVGVHFRGMSSYLMTGEGRKRPLNLYEERLSGSQAPMLYALSIVVVFLCLAALYESWSIPTAVLLVVPLGIIGALAATSLRGLSNDVYFKIGFLTIIGLSTKNAILIVEFAKDAQERGVELVQATLEAVHLRLRPILMTSFAFILGVTPLAVAWGAGSASQNAIGTGVIGGMLTAIVLAVFLVPVFYVVVRKVFKGKRSPAKVTPQTPLSGISPEPSAV